jgi:hypothetical protein
LSRPYPTAQRETDADAAVVSKQFFGAFEIQLRPANIQPGLGQFHIQQIHIPLPFGCGPFTS